MPTNVSVMNNTAAVDVKHRHQSSSSSQSKNLPVAKKHKNIDGNDLVIEIDITSQVDSNTKSKE